MRSIRSTGQYTKLDIINSAMMRVGLRTLNSLEDDSDQAVTAGEEYDIALSDILKRYKSGFPLIIVPIVELVVEDGWLIMPSDMLFDIKPKIREEGVKNGKKVMRLNASEDGNFKYITDSPNEQFFSPEFIKAMIYQLASIYALIFVNNGDLHMVYEQKAQKARLAIDAIQPLEVTGRR